MSEEKIITVPEEKETVEATTDNSPSGTDRLGAVVCHTGAFIGLNIIIPLIFVCAVDKEKKDFLYQHAKQALAFQLATFLLMVILIIGGGFLTAGAGIMAVATSAHAVFPLSALFLFFAVLMIGIAALVLICIASYKAATGQPYKYPFLGKF